jgi:hypothetical protein
VQNRFCEMLSRIYNHSKCIATRANREDYREYPESRKHTGRVASFTVKGATTIVTVGVYWCRRDVNGARSYEERHRQLVVEVHWFQHHQNHYIW